MKGGYVDGFVIVIAKNKVADYKKMATWGSKMWRKYGALDYKECMGDDLMPKGQGGMTARRFGEMTGAKKGDTVWFSFITFKSKQHRDQVNKKVMKAMMEDEKAKDMPMPFEINKMAYGGFKTIVE